MTDRDTGLVQAQLIVSADKTSQARTGGEAGAPGYSVISAFRCKRYFQRIFPTARQAFGAGGRSNVGRRRGQRVAGSVGLGCPLSPRAGIRAGPDRDVVFVGLPAAIPHSDRTSGIRRISLSIGSLKWVIVVTKEWAPVKKTITGKYGCDGRDRRAPAMVEMQPDVVILVTGDADFAYLATKLRRRGIQVEVASVTQNLGGL